MANCGSATFAFGPPLADEHAAMRSAARRAGHILAFIHIVTSIMHQDWHHLLFLHWEIPAAELQAMVPPELTIDTFEGKAYAGLIPFTLSNVRPVLTPPIPFLSRFHEVNVRTYVRGGGRYPRFWFSSLDASSALAAEAARAFYKLPYFKARIDFTEFEFVSH